MAGALIAESNRQYFLVGDFKEPCDLAAAGFEPCEIDVAKRRWTRLLPTRTIYLSLPQLTLDLEGEPLAELLAERMLIERNGSVSERLWRVILSGATEQVDVRWLAAVPAHVWNIVRDPVLKCS
jgi:hypothetical protein